MFRVLVLLAAIFASNAAFAQGFVLSGVKFSESAYLDEDELQEIAASVVDRTVVFSDLQAMIAEVQALYSTAGVVTARAILPPQEIRDGILRVDLIEAIVSRVTLDGFERTKPEFVERTISLQAGELPDFERLEKDLRIYDISHDLTPLLTFEAGDEPGTTVAVISVTEPRKFSWTASADNFGTDATGIYRGTLFGRWASVTGVRDTLSSQLQVSEGSLSGSLGYSRPVGAGGGRMIGTLSYAENEIVQGVFEQVDVLSNSLTGSLSYRRPLRVRPFSHVVLDVGIAGEQSTSTIEGEAFSDVTLAEFVLQATYARQFDRAVWSTTLGIKAGSSDAKNTSETEGEYYLAFGALSYTRNFSDKVMMDLNLEAQYAHGENLPIARLFSAGGATSVRGYPNNIRGGDSGAVMKIQVSPVHPYEPESMKNTSISPFAFLDAAIVVPYRIDGSINETQDYLASVGGGLRIDWNQKASALLMVGFPLIETLGFEDLSESTVYVGLDYKF